MILVLSGTQEGRQLVQSLSDLSYPVIASAATGYGAQLLNGAGAGEVLDRPLDDRDLAALIKHKKIQVVVDATHPFATLATANAIKACQNTDTLYIRFERPAHDLPRHPLIHVADGYRPGAEKAAELATHNIFLTTGTKTLPLFVDLARGAGKKIIARIIPTMASLKQCLDLGLEPAQIIAQLGPFSYDLNLALFKEYRADVLVTKESGEAGGVETKIKAALDLAMPVVVIQRPLQFISAAHSVEQLIKQIRIQKGSALIESKRHHFT